MTKPYQGILFTNVGGGQPYIDDRSQTYNLTGRFAIPPDMNQAQATAIAAASGGAAYAVGQLAPAKGTSCPPPGLRMRKLKFTRQDGSSISIPIPTQTTLVAQGIAIKAAFNAVDANNPVVCIDLIGEHLPNLQDILGLTGARTAGATSRPSGGSKQPYYTGLMSYLSDAINGSTHTLKLRVATDIVGGPPTEYAAIFNNQTGITGGSGLCGGSDPRKARYYDVTSLINQNSPAGAATQYTQNIKIPVLSSVGAQNLVVGQQIAALSSTLCISYYGESNNRFGLLIP